MPELQLQMDNLGGASCGTLKRIVRPKRLQFDPGYRTGAWTVMEKAMDVLNMIRNGQQKRARLSQAQFLMSKTYRGTDYTSAHQAPVLENHPDLCYRGHGYIK